MITPENIWPRWWVFCATPHCKWNELLRRGASEEEAENRLMQHAIGGRHVSGHVVRIGVLEYGAGSYTKAERALADALNEAQEKLRVANRHLRIAEELREQNSEIISSLRKELEDCKQGVASDVTSEERADHGSGTLSPALSVTGTPQPLGTKVGAAYFGPLAGEPLSPTNQPAPEWPEEVRKK